MKFFQGVKDVRNNFLVERNCWKFFWIREKNRWKKLYSIFKKKFFCLIFLFSESSGEVERKEYKTLIAPWELEAMKKAEDKKRQEKEEEEEKSFDFGDEPSGDENEEEEDFDFAIDLNKSWIFLLNITLDKKLVIKISVNKSYFIRYQIIIKW